MAAQIVFYRLSEKIVNTKEEIPEDARQVVYYALAAHGGSISAEHGIGALKRDELARRKSPVALKMMRAIKLALDPRNLMNPGRVL